MQRRGEQVTPQMTRPRSSEKMLKTSQARKATFLEGTCRVQGLSWIPVHTHSLKRWAQKQRYMLHVSSVHTNLFPAVSIKHLEAVIHPQV